MSLHNLTNARLIGDGSSGLGGGIDCYYSLLAIYPEVVRGTAALPGYCYVKCNAGIALQITGMQYVITAAGSLGFRSPQWVRARTD